MAELRVPEPGAVVEGARGCKRTVLAVRVDPPYSPPGTWVEYRITDSRGVDRTYNTGLQNWVAWERGSGPR